MSNSQISSNLTNKTQNLIAADRVCDSDLYLKVVYSLVPIFNESDNINYLYYLLQYLEMTRNLPDRYPKNYDEFKKKHMPLM